MRRSLPAILACLVALLLPAAASAHARLEGTSPPQGAVVKAEPSAVVFEFDEAVEGNFGAVRVYDAAGERVDEGDAFHPDGEGPKLGVHLKPGLPDGSPTPPPTGSSPPTATSSPAATSSRSGRRARRRPRPSAN